MRINTGTIVRECTEALESVKTEKEKHLYISIDHNHEIVNGYIEVKKVRIISFDKTLE